MEHLCLLAILLSKDRSHSHFGAGLFEYAALTENKACKNINNVVTSLPYCVMIVEMLVLLYYATSTIKLFTPISDQDRISPYNINTVSSRQVMRIKKS